MVQYRYAKTVNSKIVDADQLAFERHSEDETFVCIACDRSLIAKVKGTQRSPHFAHHPGTTCNPETYLHRLAKEVFADTFRQCVEAGTPFLIELNHPLVCRKFQDVLGTPCLFDQTKSKQYDLTDHYNDFRIEPREQSFIPDLLLFNHDEPQKRVFIEIAVTHFLSEEKEKSGERIIEIPINSEADLEKIRSRKLNATNARFVNFITTSEMLTDSDCQCAGQETYAFIVHESGKCVLDKSTLAAVATRQRNTGDKIRYFRIMDLRQVRSHLNGDYLPPPDHVFREGVERAHSEGFPLRNCYLCRYHGDNFRGTPGQPIFCKHLKMTCNSNEAVRCEYFRFQQPDR